MKRLAHGLALWLWIGFGGGAAVLVGVAVPLEADLRASGVGQRSIDATLSGVALAWVIASGAAAWILARRLRGRGLALAHLCGAAVSAAAFVAFLRADAGPLYRFRALDATVGDRFFFGAYPEAAQLRSLRADGFVGVVTLLSPAIPFEAVLIGREERAAREAGLQLVRAPMLPWVSANEASLDTIRALASGGRGKWYVHCYMGRHRAELARYVVLEAAGTAAAPPRITIPDSLERGPLVRIDSTLILGPLPTPEEWFEIVVRSGSRRVIALLDPRNRDDAPWIAQEREEAASSGVALLVLPVRAAGDARAVADTIRGAPVRTYVHGFRTDQRVQWVRDALTLPPRGGAVP